MKKLKKVKMSPGAAYAKKRADVKAPDYPSSGYVFGHSKYGGDSPSTKEQKG